MSAVSALPCLHLCCAMCPHSALFHSWARQQAWYHNLLLMSISAWHSQGRLGEVCRQSNSPSTWWPWDCKFALGSKLKYVCVPNASSIQCLETEHPGSNGAVKFCLQGSYAGSRTPWCVIKAWVCICWKAWRPCTMPFIHGLPVCWHNFVT